MFPFFPFISVSLFSGTKVTVITHAPHRSAMKTMMRTHLQVRGVFVYLCNTASTTTSTRLLRFALLRDQSQPVSVSHPAITAKQAALICTTS